jgi:intracellular sulfur oxidation DsrE/DsrF family protein
MSSEKQHRRGFLASLAAGLTAIPAAGLFNRAGAEASDHDAWLVALKGKHRQFFDVASLNGGIPLRRAHAFLATYASAYGIKESDVNAIFGAHSAALGFTFGDAAWTKYELGKWYNVNDPATGQPAVRNIWIELQTPVPRVPPEAAISRLMTRGVKFLACNNTLNALSTELAAARGVEMSAVRQDLLAAMLPGVTVVPAMVIAAGRAQEQGVSYVALG